MSNKPTLTEIVRDAALDDDFSIDEGLVLIKRLNAVYGKDKATKKALSRLADILIGVQQRSRLIHQTAERTYQAARDEQEQIAQLL
jgi:hypothetical protein